MQKLFEYRKILPHTPHGRGNQQTLIVDGDRAFIESFISKDEFDELFGGYLLTSATESPRDVAYRGVWGKDKVRKLKRLLRERGAEFEICKIDGSERWINATAQSWLPPNESTESERQDEA
jgi:hypothetical protein